MSAGDEKRDDPLAVLVDEEQRRWYIVVCPDCKADLSKVSQGRALHTLAGIVCEIYYPLRCTECGQPLLPVPQDLLIRPAGSRVT